MPDPNWNISTVPFDTEIIATIRVGLAFALIGEVIHYVCHRSSVIFGLHCRTAHDGIRSHCEAHHVKTTTQPVRTAVGVRSP